MTASAERGELRILAVCDQPPAVGGSHADGSTLISAHVLTRLARSHTVDLAYFRQPGLEPDDALTSNCRNVLPLSLEASSRRSKLLRVSSAVVRSGPRTRATLAGRSADVDVVYLHGIGTFGLAGDFLQPVVVHEVDPFSLFWRDRARDIGSPTSAVLAAIRSLRLAQLERQASAAAAAYLLVSRDDARDLGARLGRTVTALPNGVPRQTSEVADQIGVPGRIVFVGGLDYAPNIDSAMVLCREVLPLVRQSVPAAHVVLVGRTPSPEVRTLVGSNVFLAEDVPSVEDELARATVAAFPGGYGRGVRNSVLQSLQTGRPVVASTASARSVPAGAHLVVRDGHDEAAAALVALLTQPDLHAEAAASARRAALTLPDWDEAARSYEKVFRTAADSI